MNEYKIYYSTKTPNWQGKICHVDYVEAKNKKHAVKKFRRQRRYYADEEIKRIYKVVEAPPREPIKIDGPLPF